MTVPAILTRDDEHLFHASHGIALAAENLRRELADEPPPVSYATASRQAALMVLAGFPNEATVADVRLALERAPYCAWSVMGLPS